MPKRNNPFGDSSPLQQKSHISNKEVDMGVAEDQNMKIVYDKTITLLYEGAKKISPIKNDVQDVNVACSLRPLPGQRIFNTQGLLCDDQAVPMEDESTVCQQDPISCVDSSNGMNNNYITVPNGQLQIDSAGKLCSGIKVITSSEPVKNCRTCNRETDASCTGCSFCESKLCSGCVQLCDNCRNVYCHLCSRSNYDECAERILCLQCYPVS